MFEKINLVNSLNEFSKETWFGFIGSYLGAIGTIILGYITFYQNKKYKELSDRSDEHFMELQKELTATEDKITYARQFYNDSVNKYTNQTEVFPSVLIAKIFGFGTFDYFEVQETDKEVPKVKF